MTMGRVGKGEINITPMIDVLLVLIIIFMVIGGVSMGLDTRIPQPASGQPLPTRNIQITVLDEGKVRVDQTELEVSTLADHLRSLATRATTGVVFVQGKDDLEFQQVARVIDIAKGAGWGNIALMPKPTDK